MNLTDAIRWLRDHWDLPDPPAIHDTGGGVTAADNTGTASPTKLYIRPATNKHLIPLEGKLGPRFSGPFYAWINENPRRFEVFEEEGVCYHPNGHPCPDCKGTGLKRVVLMRYAWPMAAALDKLRAEDERRERNYAFVCRVLVAARLDPIATLDYLGIKGWQEGKALIVNAIGRLKWYFSDGPVASYRNLSEAQAVAEKQEEAA